MRFIRRIIARNKIGIFMLAGSGIYAAKRSLVKYRFRPLGALLFAGLEINLSKEKMLGLSIWLFRSESNLRVCSFSPLRAWR
jgi:hypothetical protein